MKKKFHYIFFILLIQLPHQLLSQDEKPLRVEIEAKYNSDSYKIIPFGEKGVLLFYMSNENNKQAAPGKWLFTLYNTDFKEVWTKEENVSEEMEYGNFDHNDSIMYLLFENNTSTKLKEVQILKIDLDSAQITSYTTTINANAGITSFKVYDDVAMLTGHTIPERSLMMLQSCFTFTLAPSLFGMTLYNYEPFIFIYNLNKGTTKTAKDTYPGQSYADDLAVDDKNGSFDVTVKNFIQRKTNAMFIDEFNADAEKISTLKLVTKDNNRKINTCKIIALDENEKILIGTYNNNTKGNKANPAFAGFTEGASGIFFSKIVNGEQQEIKFYNFTHFNNFYNYISSRRALKMMKKARRLEAKGKEISYDYRLLVHDIIRKDSDYIMIAEAYYPEYHNETYVSYDYYGRPVYNTYTVFDGYRYTNAIIACFDSKGEMKWDNSFEIMNILTFDLKERVKIFFDGDDIVLTYSNEGNIASKIISGNEVVEGKQYTEIETNYSNDKLISDYNSDMEYWYGSYFISYGYQKIKNNLQSKSKRTVFYFNKIAFQ